MALRSKAKLNQSVPTERKRSVWQSRSQTFVICLIAGLVTSALLGATTPKEPLGTFLPPSGWELAQYKNPSPFLQVGFIGKGTTEFRPSINLAIEEVDVSLKDYVKAVKEIHLEEPGTKCRDLGKFPMLAGEGRLLEVSNSSPWGESKILQALLIKENKAYILTAAVLKKDFPKVQAEILKSFRSFNLIPDLLSPIQDREKRLQAEELLTALEGAPLEKLEKALAEKFPEMGKQWQFLALQEAMKKR